MVEVLSTNEIAARLILSTNTVRNHVSEILSKQGTRTEAVAPGGATRPRLPKDSCAPWIFRIQTPSACEDGPHLANVTFISESITYPDRLCDQLVAVRLVGS